MLGFRIGWDFARARTLLLLQLQLVLVLVLVQLVLVLLSPLPLPLVLVLLLFLGGGGACHAGVRRVRAGGAGSVPRVQQGQHPSHPMRTVPTSPAPPSRLSPSCCVWVRVCPCVCVCVWETQHHCHKFADKYVEYDMVLLALDLLLHRPQARACDREARGRDARPQAQARSHGCVWHGRTAPL
jgi:hypothetical protein